MAGSNSARRFIHVVTGDAIGTNEAACKAMLRYYRDSLRASIAYRLIVLRCGAHQANLIVQLAVCGRRIKDPTDHDLSGSCVRYFKYIAPQYGEEMSGNLQAIVEAGTWCSVCAGPPDMARVNHFSALQSLYGSQVFSAAVVVFLGRLNTTYTCSSAH